MMFKYNRAQIIRTNCEQSKRDFCGLSNNYSKYIIYINYMYYKIKNKTNVLYV